MRYRLSLTAGALVTIIGTILAISQAATSTSTVEPENGTLSGVSVLSDSSASGGGAVKFGAVVGIPGCVGTEVTPSSDVVSAVNNAPNGATICFGAGVYRLVSPVKPKTNQVLWGAPGAVLDGSVLLSGWTRSGTTWYASGYLPAAYTGVGQCEDNVNNPCLFNEQVFRNGSHLTRVTSLNAITSGTFYEDYATNRVYVGDDPTDQTLEMSKTQYGIKSTATGVTVKGLTLQHFASPGQQGALVAGGASWTITDIAAQWNHALGVYLTNSDSTKVTDSSINSNGQLGMGVHASQGVTVRGNQFANNNTDGFWIADWESGGFKATNAAVTISNNTVHDNKGVGIWFDVDCKTDTISDNTIYDNGADGIRFEISYDGIITGNTITNNGFGMGRGGSTSIYAVAGINSNSSGNVAIYSNTLVDNMNGIGLQARDRGSGTYGARVLVDNNVHDNVITQRVGSAYGQGATGLVQNVSDNTYFTSRGNKFTHNTYHLDTLTAKRFAWDNTYLDKTGWQAAGQDTTGTFN